MRVEHRHSNSARKKLDEEPDYASARWDTNGSLSEDLATEAKFLPPTYSRVGSMDASEPGLAPCTGIMNGQGAPYCSAGPL